MFLNFRVMQKGSIWLVAQDTLFLSETKSLNYKSVDVAGHEDEVIKVFKRVDEEHVSHFFPTVNVDYFIDNWSGVVPHVFDNAKYEAGEWPFVDFPSCEESYEYNAQLRRKVLEQKIAANFSIPSELKNIRLALIELYEHLQLPIPSFIGYATETIESIKKNVPKNPDWKPGSELLK